MPIEKNKTGYIEVICGPMFSGKTAELLRRISRVSYSKKKLLAFKPKADDRYSKDFIVSHDGEKINCIVEDINEKILDFANQADVFAFDEVQFYDISIIEVFNKLALMDKRVIAAGLDKDSNAEPFGPMPYLLAHADYITKLNSICIICGNIANFSYRISKEKTQILIGESEKYEARCRTCFYDYKG